MSGAVVRRAGAAPALILVAGCGGGTDANVPEDLPQRVENDLGVRVKAAHHATHEEIMAKTWARAR